MAVNSKLIDNPAFYYAPTTGRGWSSFIRELAVAAADPDSVTEVTNASNPNPVTSVTYNVSDQVINVTYQDTTYRTMSYTASDLIDVMTAFDGGGATIQTLTANYDVSEKFTGWTVV